MVLSPEQIRWYRFRRSGLAAPFATPEEVTVALAGVQAQILPAAGLALWNRLPELTHAQYELLLHEERHLIKIWGQRSTLHLYPSTEWPLIYAAMSIRKTWWERDIRNKKGDVEAYFRFVAEVAELARQRDVIGREDLRDSHLDIPEDMLDSWGGIFAELVRMGYVCHAGQRDGQGMFAHREVWLPDLAWNPPDPDTANTELVRRYLHTYGPATVQDFAYWRGCKVDNGRRWFAAIGDELATIEFEGQALAILRDDVDALYDSPPEDWPVRMLYRFDPYLLAHRDKSWLVDMKHYKQVWRAAGHIEGVILQQGRIIATWRYERKTSGLAITVSPFKKSLPGGVKKVVQKDAAGVAAFFDLPLLEVT